MNVSPDTPRHRALTSLILGLLLASSMGACGGEATPVVKTPTAGSSPTSELRPTPSPSATQAATDAPPELNGGLPIGFPIDQATRLGRVGGPPGDRKLLMGAGPTVREYVAGEQIGPDPEAANASGWNCRTHVEYEGLPAVDWYVPAGTDVVTTMDGIATLSIVTTSNAFDVYGTNREPYLGDPDRGQAPLQPFPGPSGGKGVFVEVRNEDYLTQYAHLDLRPSLAAVPAATGEAFDVVELANRFAAVRPHDAVTDIVSWPVSRGDVIGRTGDSGYSEAPHLHYVIVELASGRRLCPTSEAGFSDGGWLTR